MISLQALPRRESFVFFTAALVSALLSLWISWREAVVNPDAVCYLLSAQAVGSMGIRGAMHLCGQASWPFFSALIYYSAQASHLSYTMAAYLIDAVFSLVSVCFFILTVKEMGGSRRVLWLAAALILLSHEFNSVREYIVRDHGFWAFYLISVYSLVKFFQQPRWPAAAAWFVSLFIAGLFRIEGMVFLLALPFVSWFLRGFSWRRRAACFFMLNLPVICMILAVAGWMMLHPAQTLNNLGRLAELTTQATHGASLMLGRYQDMKAAMIQHVLNSASSRDASLVIAILMPLWYLVNAIGNLSWIYTALLAAYVVRLIPPARNIRHQGVILAYVIVNIIVTFGFFTENLFLSRRYLIALSLVLMLWLPFALDCLIEQARGMRQRAVLWLAAAAIMLNAVGGVIDFGYSKAYIHQAGDWLAKNVPAQSSLYANDYQLMYYSGHFGFDIFEKARTYIHLDAIANQQWRQYDYLALRINKKEEAATVSVIKELHLTPVQVFGNQRGDRVEIYRQERAT